MQIIINPMEKIVFLIFTLLAMASPQGDSDIINIANIKEFPTGYKPKIRAGYLTITAEAQSYYYILCESQQNDSSTLPLVLWLNGGPGCSSLIGFFTENGPFYYENDTTTQMTLNPYAWNKKAHVLYLESPGTVGFSKANDFYAIQNDTTVAKNNLIALIQFFSKYPSFRGNDFYIAGESYAGIYIPRLAKQILDYNQQKQQLHINLMGLLIGNGCTAGEECSTPLYYSRYTTEFLFSRGFLDENVNNDYKSKCLAEWNSENTTSCRAVQTNIYNLFIGTGASIYNIYGKCYVNPKMDWIPEVQRKIHLYHESQQGLKHALRCSNSLRPISILNNNDYRAEFKIAEKANVLPWTPCSDKLKYTMEKEGVVGLLPELVKALKIFYYTGDLDAIVPITGTVSWFDRFRIEQGRAVKKSWRPWITQSEQFPKNQNVSGMVWELDSLTLATVRGAGHMVPSDKPAEAYQIFSIFLDPEREWQYPDYYLEASQS